MREEGSSSKVAMRHTVGHEAHLLRGGRLRARRVDARAHDVRRRKGALHRAEERLAVGTLHTPLVVRNHH